MIKHHISPGKNTARHDSELFWISKITIALLQSTPFHVFICTILYIISQVSMLASIILPWKLLMVMATENYPWMIPEVFRILSERELVLTLGATACFAFIVYIASEVSIGFVCRRGSAFILDKHQKMGLFSGHREHAALLYRRFLRAVAAIFTVGVIAISLAYLYPHMLLSLITYLAIGLSLIILKEHTVFKTALLAVPSEMKPTIWWGAGFFYAAAWLTADYWRGMLPGLATAFISLLLVRQAIVLIFPTYGTYSLFIKKRNKVDALFLSDTPWHPEYNTDGGFMELIEPTRRETLINEILRKNHGVTNSIEIISCRASNSGKSALIKVKTSTTEQPEKAFLIKLFHSSSKENALHEKTILDALPDNCLAPQFCGTHNIKSHFCHVYEWPLKAGWMSSSKRSGHLPGIREKLLTLELPDELISRYERSRPHLSDRLQLIKWDFLISISPRDSLDRCQTLQHHWPEICHAARSQPRQVIIPRIHQHLICHIDNKPVIYNWTRWLWEPVGASWPLSTNEETFKKALNKSIEQRPALAKASAKSARLMALLYELERLWRINKHTEAIRLIAPLYEAAKDNRLFSTTDPRMHHDEYKL